MDLFAALYFDEDVDVLTASMLKGRGFDVLTARDAGMLRKSDDEQIEFAAAQGRCLITHNRDDFLTIHRRYVETGREHAGIIVARKRRPVEIVTRVAELLNTFTSDEMRNTIYYV